MKRDLLPTLLVFIAVLLSSCSGGAAATGASRSPTVADTIVPTAQPATATPASAPTYEMVTVKMNSSSLTSFAPLFIADAEGYFAEYGIKIDYVTLAKTNDAVPLLASGDLDVYAGSITAGLLNVLGQENDVKVVADRGHIAPSDSCTYLGIMVRKDLYDSGTITKAADLKGQTISAANSGTTGYLLSTYLAQAGLTFNDVVLNDLPTAGYVGAFNNKSVASIVAPELHITNLLSAGNAVVLAKAQDVIGTTQLSVLAFGKNLLVDHPDVGARFMAAYLKGVQQYNLGKTDRNLQIVSDATKVSIPDLKTSCWISINADGSIDFSGVDNFQKWSVAQGQLDKPITEEQFWDPSFIAAAQKLLNP
jgi:NitT/TauT family transport system substrate-binding protein